MKTFIIVKGGIARVMSAVDSVVDPMEHVAKWLPADQAQVTSAREIDRADLPNNPEFKDAWEDDGQKIAVNMPIAREIHANHIARALIAEIARLKVKEREERINGNTAQADTHASTITALEALNLNVLAMQIANASNPTALSAIWPANMPR